MVAESVTKALQDGKLTYDKIQQAVVAYVDGNIFLQIPLLVNHYDKQLLQVNLAVDKEHCILSA